MKISRRKFLKYGTVTVAGMAVPGLVKAGLLRSDTAGAVPVPLQGEESWAESICLLCPAGCGIKVRRIGSYPVSTRGNPADPISRGGICPRGAAIIQELYHPDRLTQPLVRAGDRGAGRWHKVSWDEAIREVGKKLSEIQGSPAALAVMAGSSGTLADLLLRRFTHAFGSPNYLEYTPSFNQLPVDAFSAIHGRYVGVGYDLARAGFVLSFGADWLQAWPSPVEASRAYGELRRSRPDVRVRIVQIEPRLSITGGKADEWIPIRPGTYGALALGIAHVMIGEGLIDHEFVARHAFGFDDWTDGSGSHHQGFRTTVMNEYSAKAVAEITDVPAEVIRRLGQEFGRSHRPLALCMRERFFDQMAIHSLNALKGSIGVPGGAVEGGGAPLELLSAGAARSGGRKPVDDGFNRRLGHSAPQRLPAALLREKPYGLRVVLLSGANPAFLGPDTNRWMQALRRIPFIVSLTPFMDETSEYADVVLPTHSNLETRAAWAGWTMDGSPCVKATEPVLKPLHDTRELGDIVLQLGQPIGGKTRADLPWRSYEEYVDQIMRSASGSEQAGQKPKPPARGRTFSTPSGKFEFCSPTLSKVLSGYVTDSPDCTPHYEPIEYLGDRENYPLHLCVYSPLSLYAGDGAHLPFMPGIAGPQVQEGWGTWVEINPETAKHLGVNDGDDVWIESPLGKMGARARLYAGAMPDVVSVPLGFGHTSYGRWAKDVGSNPAAVVGAALDPYTGQPIWQSMRVRISKAV